MVTGMDDEEAERREGHRQRKFKLYYEGMGILISVAAFLLIVCGVSLWGIRMEEIFPFLRLYNPEEHYCLRQEWFITRQKQDRFLLCKEWLDDQGEVHTLNFTTIEVFTDSEEKVFVRSIEQVSYKFLVIIMGVLATSMLGRRLHRFLMRRYQAKHGV